MFSQYKYEVLKNAVASHLFFHKLNKYCMCFLNYIQLFFLLFTLQLHTPLSIIFYLLVMRSSFVFNYQTWSNSSECIFSVRFNKKIARNMYIAIETNNIYFIYYHHYYKRRRRSLVLLFQWAQRPARVAILKAATAHYGPFRPIGSAPIFNKWRQRQSLVRWAWPPVWPDKMFFVQNLSSLHSFDINRKRVC